MERSELYEFVGFDPEAFDFFRNLTRNNRKDWFHANREVYDFHVVGVLKALFENLVPVVLGLHSDFEVSGRTGKNFSRIHRDIRFSRHKAPYHHGLYLFFADRGHHPREGRLYVGLSADGVTCGLGTYHRPKGTMERLLKPRRIENPRPVETYLCRMARRYEIYWHGTERRAWRKYDGPPQSDQDWKRCRALVVRKLFSPEDSRVRSPGFAKTVAKTFRDVFPLYAFSSLEGPENDRMLESKKRK